jgi:hypothetical protein
MSTTPDELWSRAGLDLPVPEFRQAFESGLATKSDDIDAVWKLCGAACDFLRVHCGAFLIPRDMAMRLLASSCADHRVIGLKATRYMEANGIAQLELITDMLESSTELDRCVALYQLGLWIDDKTLEAVPDSIAARLRGALEAIALSGTNQDQSRSAKRRLEELTGDGLL